VRRKTELLAVATILTCGLTAAPANAVVIDLFDWGFNINGSISLTGDPLPAAVDASGFDFVSGLGVIEISVSGAGPHNVIGFFDHEIDELENTFFNETAAVVGLAAAGQSWEIDEPGFIFGDIFDNFLDNTLDNTNAFPPEDDVSMAIGFDFALAAMETATVSFFLGLGNETGGLALQQIDRDSDASIYFWGELDIRNTIPLSEPGTLWLLIAGVGGMFLSRRKRLVIAESD